MKRLILPLALVLAACGDEPAPTPPPPPPTPDTTAPVISELAVSPQEVGRGATVTATFSVDEELRTLLVRIGGRVAQCAVEDLAATCTHTITGAESAGENTVDVIAVDLAGNQASASATFTIDYGAPSLAFSTQPPALINEPELELAFTSDDSTSTFTCKVDDGEEAACTSPFKATGLSEGHHLIRITVSDAHGNTRSIQASVTVDLTAPTTTLVNGIPAETREQSHVVTFTTNDPKATFECRLDDAEFAPCASPFTVTGYPEGERTFEIRAKDEAGNVDASPVQIVFTADWTAPATIVAPVADDGKRDRTIEFSSNEPAAIVECSLYGGSFAPCSSPLTLTGLVEGTHSVLIRSYDALGNVEDPPAFIQIVVDATPPQTTLFGAPNAHTNETASLFEFSSTEANSTFECSFDGAPFAACTSPASTTLTDGPHTFEVKATDKYGNADTTPARHEWIIDTVQPLVAFNPAVPAVHMQPTLAVSFEANEDVERFECSLDGAPFAECTPPTVLTDLTATVGTGNPHVFKVRATDLAGNVGPEQTATFDIDLSTPAPGIPELIALSPSLISNTTPTLMWEAASDATAYDVEVSTSSEVDATGAFLTTEQTFDNVTTLAQVTNPLANGVYFFHVRGRNVTGPGAWSRIARFEIDNWAKLMPHPTTVTMRDIACRNASECVIVGDSATIIRTVDGGRFLDRSSNPGSGQLNSVAWAGGDNVVAVGNSGMLLFSDDFGASWTRLTTDASGTALPNVTLNGVHFKGSTGVIAGTSGTVLVSTDGGVSWTATASKPSAAASLTSALVIETTPELRLLATTSTAIYTSTNGGATWTSRSTSSTSVPDSAIAPDGTIFVGGSTRLFRSTDSGATFSEITAAAGHKISGINTLWPLDGNTVMMACSNSTDVAQTRLGTIAADGTISFVNATRTDANFDWLGTTGSYSVYVDEDLNGMMVGVNGMLYSVSGTPTAIQLTTPAGALPGLTDRAYGGNVHAISFPSATVGYVATSSANYLYKSINSGRTWTAAPITALLDNEIIYDLQFFDADNGFAAGTATHTPLTRTANVTSAPLIARTSDGGENWTLLELPEEVIAASRPVNDIAFAGPDVGFAAINVVTTGQSGTPTYALKWNATTSKFETMPVKDGVGLPLIGRDLRGVAVFDANNAFVVGDGVIARLDTAAGEFRNETTADEAKMNAVAFVDADTVVAVGSSGNAYRRTVSGGNPVWTKLTLDGVSGGTTLHDVAFNGQTGYIVGGSSVLLRTTDGGATWTRVRTPDSTLYSVLPLGPNDVFVGSGTQALYRSEVAIPPHAP